MEKQSSVTKKTTTNSSTFATRHHSRTPLSPDLISNITFYSKKPELVGWESTPCFGARKQSILFWYFLALPESENVFKFVRVKKSKESP